MNLDVVTVQDCIDMWRMKDHNVILNDGRVIGFEKIYRTVKQKEE